MTLALPAALWGLLLVPALVLLRVLALRPRAVTVPSLIPWRAAAAAAPPAGRRRALLDWPLVLQILAVSAATLGAAGPEISRSPVAGSLARQVAVVLDNSASMGARPAGGKSRLEEASARLGAEIDRLGLGGGALVVTAPEPRVVTRAAASGAELKAALQDVQLLESAGDLLGAVALARATVGPDAPLIIVSDDLTPLESLPAENLLAFRVGGPVRNFGIVAACVEDGRVFAAVRNASSSDEKVRLALVAADREIDAQQAKIIPAGGRAAFIFGPLPTTWGALELRLPADDLAADNRAVLALGPGKVAAVGPRQAKSVENALRAAGFAEPERPAPGAPAPPDARLVLSCGAWPREASPGAFALVVDPPAGEFAGFTALEETGSARPRLAEGRPEYFPRAGGYAFRVSAARRLALPPGGETLLGEADRPLIARAGGACVLAFDPDATEWVKHASFPVFVARLAERAGLLPAAAALPGEGETACRAAGPERLGGAPSGRPAKSALGARTPLAPWLFALALAALVAEWLVSRAKR